MSRQPRPRAASLARGPAPEAGAGTRIARVLERLESRSAEVMLVAGGKAAPGGVTRQELERAASMGLGASRVADLVVGGVGRVAANASLPRVLRVLGANPAPFVVVGSPAKGTEAFIDRPVLVAALPESELWRPATRIGSRGPRVAGRAGLGRRISAVSLRALEELGRRARRLGARACLVGGVVRDLFLDRPTRDLDVVVEGELEPLVQGLGRLRDAHARFLTATVVLEDGTELDLARARRERYLAPAALPRVSPAPIEEDLSRRDFTINTLALSLDPSRFGHVLDLYGGMADLERRQVRVLHGLSFLDDPTRAFRAVRLATRLGFDIEPGTGRLIRSATERGVFDLLSPARLRREIEPLLAAREFPASVRLAARHGLLSVLHPGLRLTPGLRSRLDRAAAALEWYESVPGHESFERWIVPLGLLLAEIEPRHAQQALDRISPGRRAGRVLAASRRDVAQLLARLARRGRTRPSEADTCCRDRQVESLLMALATATTEATRRSLRHHLEAQRGVRLKIDGRDLLEAGVRPGPAIARGLAAARKALLDGTARDRADQLRHALRAAAT